jgi:DNA invertase Pin-like site-specific DNA recombinase
MPAYAYLRKSVVHDLENPGASPAYQEEAVRRLAAQNDDAESLVILSDWDKSGRLGADKRPGYRALLNAIESGSATAVYSYSLSRLARSVSELSRLMADCDARGIPVRLDADKIDTATASGKLTAHVLAAVAQFEADVASERVRAVNAAKSARGERVGSVPFYGDREGDDTTAVLAAFHEAGSYSGAARLLNARNIKPRNAKPRTINGNGDSQSIWWPSSVSVVVDRLDPKARAGGRARGVRAGGSAFVLARLLRCPTCGTSLTGTRDRGGRRVRYSCRLGSVTPHPRVSVSEHLILPTMMAEADRLTPPRFVETVAEDARERVKLDQRRARVLDMYEAGDIDRTAYRERLGHVADAMSRLDARSVTLTVPDGIDWTWPIPKLNAALRALWRTVTLDPETFQPVAFDWTVPEWRS